MSKKKLRRVVIVDPTEQPKDSTEEADTKLLQACTLRHVPIARQALNQGADVNCRRADSMTPLQIAAEHGDLELVQLLCDQPGLTALHTATIVGNTKTIKKLLDNDAEVNCQDSLGRRPLHYAVYQRDIQSARVLIRHDADVNVFDVFHECPLYTSIMKRPCLPMARYLLRHGASSTCYPGKNSMGLFIELILSLRKDSRLKMVKTLVEHGVNVNTADPIGLRTPLHIVAMNGNDKLAAYLLRNGANPSARNRAGQTPMDVAFFCRNLKIARLLERALHQDLDPSPAQSATSLSAG